MSDFQWGKDSAPVAPASGGFAWGKDSTPVGPSALEAGVRGAAQGASLGFADEITGGLEALRDKLNGAQGDFSDLYTQHRDESRAAYDAAEKAHGTAYTLGNVGGAVATSFIPGLGALNATKGIGLAGTVGRAALAGGLAGVGSSKEETVGGVVGDAALGAGIGGALGGAAYGAGKLLEKGAQKLGGYAAGKVAQAEEAANALGAKERAGAIRSATGELGAETNKGVRGIEVYDWLKAKHPEAFANVDPGKLAELEATLAQNTGEMLPNQVNVIAGKRAALEGLQSSPVDDFAAPFKESRLGQDAKELFKSYGEPLVGAYLGSKLGGDEHGAAGGTLGMLGGLVMGRTRAGKAIAMRLARPGNQMAAFGALGDLAGRLGGEGSAVTEALASTGRVGGIRDAASEAIGSHFPSLARMMKGDSAKDRYAKNFGGTGNAIPLDGQQGQ